jgi:hypothetical protein
MFKVTAPGGIAVRTDQDLRSDELYKLRQGDVFYVDPQCTDKRFAGGRHTIVQVAGLGTGLPDGWATVRDGARELAEMSREVTIEPVPCEDYAIVSSFPPVAMDPPLSPLSRVVTLTPSPCHAGGDGSPVHGLPRLHPPPHAQRPRPRRGAPRLDHYSLISVCPYPPPSSRRPSTGSPP